MEKRKTIFWISILLLSSMAGVFSIGNVEADDDSDGDGVPDASDNCPSISNPDQNDTDNDGVGDVCDICPGHNDTMDDDNDGTPDGCDGCPGDPDKTEPGVCGCGVADTDTDTDGVSDCNDNCPSTSNSDQEDMDGDGIGDVCDDDVDGDGTINSEDNCSYDPDKTEPGVCGCGVADTDTDGDGVADCVDNCPSISNSDQNDSDGDGVGNVCDICPGSDDNVDTDSDTIPDGCDNCISVPNSDQADMDGDGMGDVCDNDTDGDGVLNEDDNCSYDPNKTEPGVCGCGVADTDTDGDGTLDCDDGCPDDSSKVSPGGCGCGVADTDRDSDGTLDCNDNCPDDSNKASPGVCGCGVADTDTDSDGVPDCNDICSGYDDGVDSDGDGIPDGCDDSDDRNIPPTADAGGPYYEIAGVEIIFNGYSSTDTDGSIQSYNWDFGDGTDDGTGVDASHTYTKNGEYTVKLTVVDNGGKTDVGTTTATITGGANNIPDKPTVTGNETGTIDTNYTYTAQAEDPDGDTVCYVFNWGDTSENTTEYVASNTTVDIVHKWAEPGAYILTVYTKDIENATSESEKILVVIDVDLGFISDEIDGYLIDYNQDGVYTMFYNDETADETNVAKQEDGTYLIDSDGDDTWDYSYDPVTETLTAYEPATTGTEPGKETDSNRADYTIIYIAIAGIVVIAAIGFLCYKNQGLVIKILKQILETLKQIPKKLGIKQNMSKGMKKRIKKGKK
jgi:PKD repeat protein